MTFVKLASKAGLLSARLLQSSEKKARQSSFSHNPLCFQVYGLAYLATAGSGVLEVDERAGVPGGRVHIQSLSLHWGRGFPQPGWVAAEDCRRGPGSGPEAEAAGPRRAALAGGRSAGVGQPGIEPAVTGDAE